MHMSGFNNSMQSVCGNWGPGWILVLSFPHYVSEKPRGDSSPLEKSRSRERATHCWKEAGEWGMMEQQKQHEDGGVDWAGLAFGGQNEELKLDCRGLDLYQGSPPRLESCGLWAEFWEWLTEAEGSQTMMNKWFSTLFNCAMLGCSNICAGWDFSSSPLAEALLFSLSPWAEGGLFEPAALPVLLTQPCLAQGSGLGFITEVSAVASLLSARVSSLLKGQWCKRKIHLGTLEWHLHPLFSRI